MFHGAGSNKEQQLEYSAFGPVAAAGGGLLVLPDALGQPPLWSPFDDDELGVVPGVHDLQFFDDLLRRVGQDFCVDPSRVLAAGLSSGGFMAAALGCQRSGKVTAVGAVAATLWVAPLCDDAAPVGYAYFHGTADEVVPYDGGEGAGLSTEPVVESSAAWAAQNGCDPDPTDERVGTEVIRRTWPGCDAPTVLYTVEGGGHTWPGSPIESDVGHTTQDIDASQIIWDVFESTWP
jgi:polyhydroxybutyrate depolymerase